ncbi:MAG: beta-ketoacyl-[acyl-carrier-protein] synthase family protein [Clostridiales bacterium]|jgi:3-oxoacyl-[acyl-carrier-protein] synthase II|nr:beta-ketoacyl-[acyl-carrier-protein] synthase family protein [Clostridiales bacterium]
MDRNGNDKRMAIVGMGVVSPIGSGLNEYWSHLLNGTYGIGITDFFDERMYSQRLYGEIKDFDFDSFKKEGVNIGRASAFGLEAARQAFEQAGLPVDSSQDAGVCVGTILADNITGEEIFINHGEDRLKAPFSFSPVPLASQNIAKWFHLSGPNSTICTACSSSAYALANSCEMIRNGIAPMMVTGGVESVSYIGQANFMQLHALDSEIIRPFDKDRRGTLLGEGSGIIIIEPLDRALARGATILAEVTGIGLSCDGYHESAPDPSGRQTMRAMRHALSEASLSPKDIDCVCAHGTGTIYNDSIETKAIKEVFKDHAQKVSITAIKSMIGHSVGAAFSMQIVASVLMMRNSTVVPTINYQTPDTECDLDYTVNAARKKEIRNVMINSYAFGGNNASVIISQYAD